MDQPNGRQALTHLIDASRNIQASSSSTSSLKRSASASFEGCEREPSRKRMKEDIDSTPKDVDNHDTTRSIISSSLLDDLARELERTDSLSQNGGTNCPTCRGPSTVVTPFRALQSIVDAFLRAAPHKSRTERERQQADEIYKVGHSIRIPPPREPSPEADLEAPGDFARPCPHCVPDNPYGWRCPQPIPDPAIDIDHAWHLENGSPPGHAQCGNCENLLATHAPNTTTKCDLCQVYFCGIGVRDRCVAMPLHGQQPHGLSDVGDLILSSDAYECFNHNHVEIVTHIQSQPRGFKPLIERDLFSEMHGVAPGIDSDPEAPRVNVCRQCATEVFFWGFKDWWVRERQKGFLEEAVTNRKDCPDGEACGRQTDHTHAREFNHILPNSGFEQLVIRAERMATESEPLLAEAGPSSTGSRPPSSLPPGLVISSVRDVLEPPEVPNIAQSFWNVFDRENMLRVPPADASSS
ncbi:hypothetical protein C0992_011424 [Termitomyces sp. T32_za158]|nr:hypothetical protein C0992_011424 [Termitomyces sp. T32_za158]